MLTESRLKIFTKCTISMNIKTRSNVRLDNVLRIEDREEEQNLIICMNNYYWSPRTRIIDVLIAIYAQHVKALERINHNRLSSNRFKAGAGQFTHPGINSYQNPCTKLATKTFETKFHHSTS